METDGVVQEGKRGTKNYYCMYYESVVADGGEGKIRYDGGSRKCVLVRERMGLEEWRGLVQEIVGIVL